MNASLASVFESAAATALSQVQSLLESATSKATDAVAAKDLQAAEIEATEFAIKAAADANAEKAKTTLGTMAEFMTEEPFVREGEVIWGFDGDQSLVPGYVRHVFVDIDPAKYDALLSFFDTTTEKFSGVPGLRSVRLARILPNRISSMAVYDNKASADAGQENLRSIMGGMAEFVTGDYNIREGEEIIRHDYRSADIR